MLKFCWLKFNSHPNGKYIFIDTSMYVYRGDVRLFYSRKVHQFLKLLVGDDLWFSI